MVWWLLGLACLAAVIAAALRVLRRHEATARAWETFVHHADERSAVAREALRHLDGDDPVASQVDEALAAAAHAATPLERAAAEARVARAVERLEEALEARARRAQAPVAITPLFDDIPATEVATVEAPPPQALQARRLLRAQGDAEAARARYVDRLASLHAATPRWVRAVAAFDPARRWAMVPALEPHERARVQPVRPASS